MSTLLRTGIDIIEVTRLSGMNPNLRERFLAHVYTPRELTICKGQNERLAGRFAAKEAVSKALGTGFGEITCQDIEILNDDAGAPVLQLHGAAAAKAESLGLHTWSVSISHLKEYAAAVAVAAE